MSDIVERLRKCYADTPAYNLRMEAAEEIKRMQDQLWQEAGNRVEIERLRAVVNDLAMTEKRIDDFLGMGLIIKEQTAEIERLKIENNIRVMKLLAQIVALTTENERLRAVVNDQAAAIVNDQAAAIVQLDTELAAMAGKGTA